MLSTMGSHAKVGTGGDAKGKAECAVTATPGDVVWEAAPRSPVAIMGELECTGEESPRTADKEWPGGASERELRRAMCM
ncbi:Uncharacterized protein PBTT_05489 [Plasmodiophora brassicae]